MALQQMIPLKSIRNARELGGYPTADGRTVKNGVLLRTANLSEISGEDIRLLTEDFRLRHIIDFRMDMEIRDAADPSIIGTEYHHLNVIDTSTFPDSGDTDGEISMPDIVQSVELSEQIGAMDGRMYVGFLASTTGKKAYSDFFRILLSCDPDCAVLWHCTSGKDRTGLAAMLLLAAFGVDEETIVEDYLLTNTFNAQRIAGTKQMLKAEGYDDAFIEKAALVLDAVDVRNMRVSLAFLNREYGSVVGYIRDGLNMTQEEIDSLKEKYLT